MQLNSKLILEKVKEYILQTSYADDGVIQDNTLIFNEGYFDSMGFVMLISFLEENFGLVVADDELIEENFESIDAITAFVGRKSN
jgi:acyl carrier protein